MTDEKFVTIAVLGDQSIADYKMIRDTLKTLVPKIEKMTGMRASFITGGASGAESTAKIALEGELGYGGLVHELKPDWQGKGRYAGVSRSDRIARDCDCAIVFTNGDPKRDGSEEQSRETEVKLNFLEEQGKLVFVVSPHTDTVRV